MTTMMTESLKWGKSKSSFDLLCHPIEICDCCSLTHNDEMCNVMLGYLYERNNSKQIDARVPFTICWENSMPDVSA